MQFLEVATLLDSNVKFETETKITKRKRDSEERCI